MKAFISVITLLAAPLVLSGCQTVKLPDADFLKIPEFRELVKNNQTNVPDISEIPTEPENVRTDAGWDEDAMRLIEMRDGFVVPDSQGAAPTQQDLDAEFARRKAQAQAYKLDDPQ